MTTPAYAPSAQPPADMRGRRGHVIDGPWQEKKWPNQWIAMCSCGRGIRCNDQATADAFLDEACR